jgi:hypothetical protein
MSGQSQKIPPPATKNHEAVQEKHIIHRSDHRDLTVSEDQTLGQANQPAAVSGEKRTIIVGKRKTVAVLPEEQDPRSAWDKSGPAYPKDSDDEDMSVELRDTVFRARDEVFEGKGVRKPTLPQARDSTLLHTELRSRKKSSERDNAENDDTRVDMPGMDPVSIKKRIRSDKKP